jgi:hypothetical protein
MEVKEKFDKRSCLLGYVDASIAFDKKIYLVKYSTGQYEDYNEKIIFATFDKQKAIKYVSKFNQITNKWDKYYSKYNGDYRWIKDEYVEKYFNRWYMLHELNNCTYEEINIR